MTFDVIVIGVGAMGSSTCYWLAARGQRVLGIERFDIPHERGSHAGQSRIIRMAYAEHPDYVPLLVRAYENWKALEDQTGAQVYFKTGLMYFGRPRDPLITGIHESATRYGIVVNALSERETMRKYPQFNVPSGHERLEEPNAGFVTPERCVLLFAECALRHGATILTNTTVRQWRHDGRGITVTTDKGDFTGRKLVITAGPWAGQFIPALGSRLTVTRQAVAWVTPRDWTPFALGRFPCWIADQFYGFPILPAGTFGGPIGLKVARHFPGVPCDPDHLDRAPSAADERELIDALRAYVPGAYRDTRVVKICLYTNTPDEHFILDFLPGFDQDVAVAAGFSGHGFKFSSVVGEVMADLAMHGRTPLPIGFLSARRFDSLA